MTQSSTLNKCRHSALKDLLSLYLRTFARILSTNANIMVGEPEMEKK